MPGTFAPGAASTGLRDACDAKHLRRFSRNENAHRKTQAQRNLLTHLDALSTILVFHQLIKYCHLATLLPVLLHFLMRRLLSVESITESSENSSIQLLLYAIEGDESGRSRTEAFYFYLAAIRSGIFLKFVLVAAYHTLFIVAWMVPIADAGDLRRLENGTWWVVSFLGQGTIDYDAGWLQWRKVWEFGLVGLLLTDCAIFAIEAIIYQCVFWQLTVSPVGRAGHEMYTIWAKLDHAQEASPGDILWVRLYDAL